MPRISVLYLALHFCIFRMNQGVCREIPYGGGSCTTKFKNTWKCSHCHLLNHRNVQ